jgi:hypothetical protein
LHRHMSLGCGGRAPSRRSSAKDEARARNDAEIFFAPHRIL